MTSCTSMQSMKCREFEMRFIGNSSIEVERQCMTAILFVSASVSARAIVLAYCIASSSRGRCGWFIAMCFSMVLNMRV